MTLEQLQAKRESILDEMGGAQRVEFESRGVTYRPQEEQEKALAFVDAEIAKLQSPGASRVFTVQSKRGLA